jgi:hypothetical protein
LNVIDFWLLGFTANGALRLRACGVTLRTNGYQRQGFFLLIGIDSDVCLPPEEESAFLVKPGG